MIPFLFKFKKKRLAIGDIVRNSKWSESHGAVEGSHYGMGGIYYSIPYALKAAKCVCLGSGGAFVPKLMLEAQQQLLHEGLISSVDVSLVDADVGDWGRPVYGDVIRGYPDIQVIKSLTAEAAPLFQDINYLHIDADHSYEGAMLDLQNYGSRMSNDDWAITVHDTCNVPYFGTQPPIGTYQAARDWSSQNNHDMVNFTVGCGTALILPRKGL